MQVEVGAVNHHIVGGEAWDCNCERGVGMISRRIVIGNPN